MSSINKVILLGFLGRDPELRHTPTGTPVCDMSIATSEKWKDRDGNPHERTEWHKIVTWNQLAENCAKYLVKGRQIYVEGKIVTKKWTDKQGVERSTKEVVAEQIIFLGNGTKSGDRERTSTNNRDQYQQRDARDWGRGTQRDDRRTSSDQEDFEPGSGDDDIPF